MYHIYMYLVRQRIKGGIHKGIHWAYTSKGDAKYSLCAICAKTATSKEDVAFILMVWFSTLLLTVSCSSLHGIACTDKHSVKIWDWKGFHAGSDRRSEGVSKETWLKLVRSCALHLLRCFNLQKGDQEFEQGTDQKFEDKRQEGVYSNCWIQMK
jgi:hypothetical protein